MKTKYLLVAITAFTIAGCSQNEITEQNPDANPAIGFGVYTGVQTKGTETTVTTIETPGFGVMALNEGKTAVHMTEKKVTKSGGSWTYTDAAYWPADKSALNFYAYAPYSGTSNSGITTTNFANDATPKIDFAIQTTHGNMVDLVAAKKESIKQADASGTVALEFKHILTRLAFTASTDVTGATIKVTDLEFPVVSGGEFYKSATYKFIDDAWENPANIDAAYTITNIDKTLSSSAVSLLGGDDKYLFCIPVNGNTGSTTDKIKVKIKYTMTSGSATSNGEKEVSIPAGHFKKGQAYKYNFAIGLNAISFDVTSVGAWTTSSGDTSL